MMDKFICGICTEEFSNVLAFLQHKVNRKFFMNTHIPKNCFLDKSTCTYMIASFSGLKDTVFNTNYNGEDCK